MERDGLLLPVGRMRFLILAKSMKALLSLFAGPRAAASSDIMGDITGNDGVRLNFETYEGSALIKSLKKMRVKTALQ